MSGCSFHWQLILFRKKSISRKNSLRWRLTLSQNRLTLSVSQHYCHLYRLKAVSYSVSLFVCFSTCTRLRLSSLSWRKWRLEVWRARCWLPMCSRYSRNLTNVSRSSPRTHTTTSTTNYRLELSFFVLVFTLDAVSVKYLISRCQISAHIYKGNELNVPISVGKVCEKRNFKISMRFNIVFCNFFPRKSSVSLSA